MSHREWEINNPDWQAIANHLFNATNDFQNLTPWSNQNTIYGCYHPQCNTQNTTKDRPSADVPQEATPQIQFYNQQIHPQLPVPHHQLHQQFPQYNAQQASKLKPSHGSRHTATTSQDSSQLFYEHNNPTIHQPTYPYHLSLLQQIRFSHQQPRCSQYNQYHISNYQTQLNQGRRSTDTLQGCDSYNNNCGYNNNSYSTTPQKLATSNSNCSNNTITLTQTSITTPHQQQIVSHTQQQLRLPTRKASEVAVAQNQEPAVQQGRENSCASPPWVLDLRTNLDQLAEDHNKELLHWVVILSSFYEDIEREISKIQKLQCAFLNTKEKLRRSTLEQRIIQQHDGVRESQWNRLNLVTSELSTFLVYLPHQVSTDISQGGVPLQHLGRQVTQGMIKAAQSIVRAYH